MANLFTPSIPRIVDQYGAVVSGAKMYFYYTGTLNVAPVFTSVSGTIPLGNPVIADSTGIFPSVYMDPTVTYRIRWTKADGTLLRPDVDPCRGFDETQASVNAANSAALASAAAVQTALDRIATSASSASSLNSANIATAAALLHGIIQFNPATPTVPPAGVSSGSAYFVVDANPATKLTSYLNTAGTGAPTTTPVVVPLMPSLASVIAQLSENLPGTAGVASPITGSTSSGARWVFYGATNAHDLLVTSMVVDVKATGAQKLEFWTGPVANVYTQAMADVVVTPVTTGLQTLVAPTHFTAFTMPAGVRPGMFGNWVGYLNGSENQAVLGSGADGATTFTQPTISAIDFQIQLIGTYSSPINLSTRLATLDAAVAYPVTITATIGANALVAGSLSATPAGQTWTLTPTLTLNAPVTKLFIDAKTTGTLTVKLFRSGSQVGADYTYTITSTGPQYVTVSIPALIGDKLKFTGIVFGYDTPSVGDSVVTDELGSSYGFRIGATQTNVTTTPLKTKVADLAANSSDLIKSVACWGDSLTAYIQDPANSYPSQLATLLGIPCYNGGVSGDTSTQIKTRFLAAPDKFSWINVFWVGRNNFSSPDTVMADLKTMVAALTPAQRKRLVIMSIWNGDTEFNVGPSSPGSGAANKVLIDALNERIRVRYPQHFLDCRRSLVLSGISEAGVSPTGTDSNNILQDVIPASLRIPGDYLHGNDKGYGNVARQLADFMRAQGWL